MEPPSLRFGKEFEEGSTKISISEEGLRDYLQRKKFAVPGKMGVRMRPGCVPIGTLTLGSAIRDADPFSCFFDNSRPLRSLRYCPKAKPAIPCRKGDKCGDGQVMNRGDVIARTVGGATDSAALPPIDMSHLLTL